MVVVKLKTLDEILKVLKPYLRVSIFACEIGSGRCRQGGIKEAERLAGLLEANKKRVVEVMTTGGTCVVSKVEKKLLNMKPTDVVLSLACGAGTQVIAETVNVPVVSGVSTMFIGSDKNAIEFEEYCIACGNCILADFGGICPIARCPKSLLNGPCGGAVNGNCEVNPQMPCVWFLIHKRLELIGEKDRLKKVHPPLDYSKSVHPRRFKNEL